MSSNAGQVILVEGIGDLHAVAGFFHSLKLTSLYDGKYKGSPLRLVWCENNSRLNIVSADSVQKVNRTLKTLHVLENDGISDCKVLALIVDADESLENRWRSVQSTLQAIGHEPPDAPKPCGTVLVCDSARIPRVGVWIMPDNQRSGMLETFLGMCVPQGGENPIWQRALAQTDAVHAEIDEPSRFKDVHLDKARIHSYLAWNDPPGVPLGQAILKNILDSRSEHAGIFLQWIRDVFEFHSASGGGEQPAGLGPMS